MDGVLDGASDVMPGAVISHRAHAWYKTTISSFSLCEMISLLEDEGWNVRPLLICRDVRAVFSSLTGKAYGQNGTTAEDPPLRLRFRRFKSDWEQFRRKGWPMLQYEKFVVDPERVLQETCDALGLSWDPGMLTWPKTADAITDFRNGNNTFHQTRGRTLLDSIKPPAPLNVKRIGAADLAWLEHEFAEYNEALGYPRFIHGTSTSGTDRSVPCYEATRRCKWMLQKNPVRRLLMKFGIGLPAHPAQAAASHSASRAANAISANHAQRGLEGPRPHRQPSATSQSTSP